MGTGLGKCGEVGMIDREKVIKGLKKCKRCECDDCTEKGASQAPWDCPAYDNFVDSAIVMLEEHEAVEPITEYHLFLCPVCKNTLFREQKFCHECGKRIEWEGQ